MAVDPGMYLVRRRCFPRMVAKGRKATMTSDPAASVGTAKSQLRGRIISTYQRAQRIITAAASSPSANTHAAMIAYDKAREHLRAAILLASRLFADTDGLVKSA
ncbi:hypothetical protein AYJ54_33230 [Bradyrhizobium centrolobii]|uniref:Uncharacterized protein n=2 Tax=Bradyrhizobium centrolobii TaxID=1505087 RepID=A0A176Y763_9BRAD|nr:hypothetical protein AYJ54_33230 [Bradyrhizobium centrolobii]